MLLWLVSNSVPPRMDLDIAAAESRRDCGNLGIGDTGAFSKAAMREVGS
jgi:hypothetical protein